MAVVVITTAQEDVKRRRINPHRTEDRLRENSQEKLIKRFEGEIFNALIVNVIYTRSHFLIIIILLINNYN